MQAANGFERAQGRALHAGQDFDVAVSLTHATPRYRAEKKRTHMTYWSAETTAGAWHFLTGEESEIRRVTAAAGFSFQWDEATAQFAHVSGVLVTTPDGRLSRYFYGVEYSPKELRMALVESGAGRLVRPSTNCCSIVFTTTRSRAGTA
jgi:protein SCO1/2